METKLALLGKGQDFVTATKSVTTEGKPYVGTVLCDGHGTDNVINRIRELDHKDILDNADPIKNLHNSIQSRDTVYNSGSTCSIVRLFNDKVEFSYVGDSKSVMFINNELVYITAPHNLSNGSEVARLKKDVFKGPIPTVPSKGHRVVDSITIASVESPYINFFGQKLVNMTQCIGSRGITGFSPTYVTGPVRPGQKCKIITASDGLWDMLAPEEIQYLCHLNAKEIMNIATGRWSQQWVYRNGVTSVITGFPANNWDDVAISVLYNYGI